MQKKDPQHKLYQQHLTAYQTGDVHAQQEAIKKLDTLADQGHQEAQLLLGVIYLYGEDLEDDQQGHFQVPENPARGIAFLTQALAQGMAWAGINLGTYHQDGTDEGRAKAIDYYQQADKMNLPEASYELMCLATEEDNAQEAKRLAHRYIELLERHVTGLQLAYLYPLLHFYQAGQRFIPLDHAKVLHWCEFSVQKKLGPEVAWQFMAWVYENGIDITRNTIEADTCKSYAQKTQPDLEIYNDLCDAFTEKNFFKKLDSLSLTSPTDPRNEALQPWMDCFYPLLYRFYPPQSWVDAELLPKIRRFYTTLSPTDQKKFDQLATYSNLPYWPA